jgi:hypothetical protein
MARGHRPRRAAPGIRLNLSRRRVAFAAGRSTDVDQPADALCRGLSWCLLNLGGESKFVYLLFKVQTARPVLAHNMFAVGHRFFKNLC